MTFKRFEEIFKSRYPDGTVWMHDDYMSHSGNRQKVGVEFAPNTKVYLYRGAYEDILCRIGIKTISKERLAEAEIHLEHLKRRHGDPNMFFPGLYTDCMEDIIKTESFLAEVRRDYVIA
jgi:hypothetical protein